jgi:hypothetical protein
MLAARPCYSTRMGSRGSWLAALLAIAPACYASHAPEHAEDIVGIDAGAAPPMRTEDGGGCGPDPATVVVALDCPATAFTGEPIAIEVTHVPTVCCGVPGDRVEATRLAPGEVSVTTSWDGCACCESCRCVTLRQTRRVEIGSFDAGALTVHAGTHRCTIRVSPGDG